MPRRKNVYSDWSKEELIKHIRQIEKHKKYGLVWDEERTKEQFETEAENSLPVLVEAPEFAIETHPYQPTHILIEGENYHALSVLNYTHEKSVDVIYIDPPYNKGVMGTVDFRYNDKFIDKEDAFRHSKWLSFISKRLVLARSLLKESGIIFISIDEVEFAQLKLLCDEIYGEANMVGMLIWKARSGKGGTADKIAAIHEYILCYAKSKQYSNIKPDIRVGSRSREQLRQWGSQGDNREDRETMFFEIPAPDGTMVIPIKTDGSEGRWRVGKKTAFELLESRELEFELNENEQWQIYRIFPEDKITATAIDSLLNGIGTASDGTKDLQKIFGDKTFDTAKPVSLISYLIEIGTDQLTSPLIVDFFAGSGTTAQAIIELNHKDDGNRQCILITNNENNIMTEVCCPRVHRVIKGYDCQGKDKSLLYESKVNLTQLRRANEIYMEYQQVREENGALYDELKGEFKDNTIRLWGIKDIDGWKEGLGGNLKYYRTAFVPAEPTDANKELLTFRSVEMLCLKENTFDFVTETDAWKIYENHHQYTGILFDQLCIPAFMVAMAELEEKPISVYVFSLGDDNFAPEFSDMGTRVSVRSIPEAILRVYRRIYQ